MKKIILSILSVCLAMLNVWGQTPGKRDSTFAVDGLALSKISTWNVSTAMTLQPDGKILLAGFTEENERSKFTVIRLLPDGQPDTGFGQNGFTQTSAGNWDNQAFAIALQPDGKILVSGYSNTTAGWVEDAVLMRFLPTGSLDSSFNGTGMATLDISNFDRFYALALQADGKILAAGRTDQSNKTSILVARFSTDGALDTSYNNTGYKIFSFTGISSLCTSIALQPDGKLVLGGASGSSPSQRSFGVARLTTQGSLDPSFGTNGVRTTALGIGSASGINSILIQPDGYIVAVGVSVDAGVQPGYLALTRYKPTGAPDNSFGVAGKVRVIPAGTYCSAESVALRSDGRILVAGRFKNSVSNFDMSLTQFLPNGTIDTTFGTQGSFMTAIDSSQEGASMLLIQPDGKILVAGNVCSAVDSSSEFMVTRFIPSMSVGVVNAPSSIQSPLVYPNPIRAGSTTVKYELLDAAPVNFEWYALNGELIQVVQTGEQASGEHTEMLNIPENLSNGMYVLNIRTDRGNVAVRIALQRN